MRKPRSLYLFSLSNSSQEKRSREVELQKRFNRRMFDTLYNLKDAFVTADKDYSGFIEKGELKDVLKEVMGICAGLSVSLDLSLS